MNLIRKSPYHYTLLCDPDEFIHYSYSGISLAALLHELKACGAQLHVPWCMAPLPAAKGRLRGFFGHIGKPLAPSSLIRNIASDHCFSCAKGTNSLPIGPLGVFLIHYWGRTFNDILIKDFCRLIQDGKSHGLSPSSIISSGTLTPRLKILAYLACQRRFLRVPDYVSGFVDECAEEELLRLVMTDHQRRKIQKLYQSYRRKIAIKCLPTYPLLNLSDALKYLPA